MKAFLPILFIVLAAGALLLAISFLWASLRALFGGQVGLWVTQSAAVRRREELLEEKDTVLRSLKDLEFERDAGKISDEDYKRLEAEFRARARRVLKQLDEDLREHRGKADSLIQAELKKAGFAGAIEASKKGES
ncbi:MAG: hypothetical protein QM778_27320 [Myxococcales bacterium]